MEFFVATKAGSILGPIASLFGIVMDLLFRFTSSFGVFNIGVCIILFTIITRLLLFPLTLKQQKSSKMMALMNPEIAAIQKKYKGKTDQTSMAKQQVEMKAVYEKYGSSPTAGCLPLLIQFPIILALYRVIYNIPAYVPSVRVFFENVVEPLQNQPDFASKLIEVGGKMSNGFTAEALTNPNKVIDLLYKFLPDNWKGLENAFPSIADVIAQNADKIEQMNSFLGINLATAPFTGFSNITVAWIIPILAGITQWLSTKLMSTNQTMDKDAPGAQMMNSMMITMPLSHVYFTLPAGIGIYWVVQGIILIFQQMFVNSYMKKVDMDELIRKNVEKMNKKRAKKGLPPAKINQNAAVNLKSIQAKQEEEEAEKNRRLERNAKQVKDSTEFYNSDPKPGSLAAKARMVQKYNEKHNK